MSKHKSRRASEGQSNDVFSDEGELNIHVHAVFNIPNSEVYKFDEVTIIVHVHVREYLD